MAELPNTDDTVTTSEPDATPVRRGGAGIRILLPLLVAALVFGLDRASKVAIENALQMHHAVPVIGDYVRLVLWYNFGAAFGITLGGAWVHIALSMGAMVLVGYMAWSTPDHDRLSFVGFGMIFGGVVGNLYDRIAAGKVTDFIDVGIGTMRWPTFNFADSAVVVGIFLLLVAYVLSIRDSVVEDSAGVEAEVAVPAVETEEAPVTGAERTSATDAGGTSASDSGGTSADDQDDVSRTGDA